MAEQIPEFVKEYRVTGVPPDRELYTKEVEEWLQNYGNLYDEVMYYRSHNQLIFSYDVESLREYFIRFHPELRVTEISYAPTPEARIITVHTLGKSDSFSLPTMVAMSAPNDELLFCSIAYRWTSS